MDTSKKRLLLEQTSRKLEAYRPLDSFPVPPQGWIRTIRKSLGMSLRQLSNRLNITPQSLKEIEYREASGNITINKLKEVGGSLNLKLVYGFVPVGSSLEEMLEKKAKEIAKEIVLRTSKSMELEDQKNAVQRIENAIKNRTSEIILKMPKYLWD